MHFVDNNAKYGGGIFVEAYGVLTLKESSFSSTVAFDVGWLFNLSKFAS